MKNLFLVAMIFGLSAVSIASQDYGPYRTKFATSCPSLSYPTIRISALDADAQNLGMIKKVSDTEFEISYDCSPSTCYYYRASGWPNGKNWGVFLDNDGGLGRSVSANDPHIVAAKLTQQDAIQKSQELVSEGRCAKSEKMPFDFDL